jgi:hypothetical protein
MGRIRQFPVADGLWTSNVEGGVGSIPCKRSNFNGTMDAERAHEILREINNLRKIVGDEAFEG